MPNLIYQNPIEHLAEPFAGMPFKSRLHLVPDVAQHVKSRGLLSGAELKSGYLPRNEKLDQILNQTAAALFLLLTAPIFFLVIILQKLSSPGPIFYKGPRFGKDKKIFEIYKFRTLLGSAKKLTNAQTLPRRNLSETKLGPYLRASRLDELPQLLNILRGEMVFFGPRPIRPEMERVYASEVPRYEERFTVKPGLVGLSQAIMTHETPKAARARFNGMCCRTHVNYLWMAGFVFYVGLCVLVKSARVVVQAIRDTTSPTGGHKWLRSGFSKPPKSRVEMTVNGQSYIGALCGVSDEVLQFVSTVPFPQGKNDLFLIRERRRGRIARVRVDAFLMTVTPVGLGQSGYAQYATYVSQSPLAVYMIERYFLRSAVVPS